MTTDQGDKRKIDYEVKQVINEDCDSMDRESTRDPDEDVPDVKTHVVWNYDPETAVHEGWKRYSTAVSACEEGRQWQNALVLFLDMPANGNKATDHLEAEVPREPGSAERGAVRGEALKPRLVEAYETGSRIEYFSRSQGKWAAGVVDSSGIINPWSDLPVYEVTIGVGVRKQIRAGVELSMLRLPLKPSDPVEVYSAKTKSWLAGTVKKEQGSVTSLGYQVEVWDGPEKGVLVVSASSLRPRFPEQSLVEIYISGQGWVPGAVMSEHRPSSSEGNDRELQIALEEGKLVNTPSYQVRFVDYPRQFSL